MNRDSCRAISIPYGSQARTLRVRDPELAAILSPREPARGGLAESEIVRQALAHPIGSPGLAELAVGKRRVLVITSDHTRPVPSKITLPPLLAEIRRGNPAAEITILVATGLHRATTESELREKFGDEIVDAERLVVHDARAPERLVCLGTLPSGGELWLNRLIGDADLVTAEGFVEPHFFAGFSGGRKSVLPGCAGEKTICWNHNARFIASDNARTGRLRGNPIHEDMLFAAGAARLAFILNVLLDREKRVMAAFAGDPVAAHEEGCKLSRAHCEVHAVPSDIVIAGNGGYPLDQNVYQCVKGLTAAEACVNPGGAIVFCAEARDGAGGDAFFHWFADRTGPAAVAGDIEGIPPAATGVDQWQAQILARVLKKASCVFVTGVGNREIVEKMGFFWAGDLEDGVEKARKIVSHACKMTVIPDGVGVIVRQPE